MRSAPDEVSELFCRKIFNQTDTLCSPDFHSVFRDTSADALSNSSLFAVLSEVSNAAPDVFSVVLAAAELNLSCQDFVTELTERRDAEREKLAFAAVTSIACLLFHRNPL